MAMGPWQKKVRKPLYITDVPSALLCLTHSNVDYKTDSIISQNMFKSTFPCVIHIHTTEKLLAQIFLKSAFIINLAKHKIFFLGVSYLL